MRIGEYSFKRRYSAAQILVDIFSAAALGYTVFVIFACIADIDRIKQLNRTDADMSIFDWHPLIIWPCVGAVIVAVSFFLIFRKKKKPKKLYINKNNVRKYCNIIDTCIALIRLMLLIAVCELSNLHYFSIIMWEQGISVQLIFDALIIVGILVITRMRLISVSDTEREKDSGEKSRQLIQD